MKNKNTKWSCFSLGAQRPACPKCGNPMDSWGNGKEKLFHCAGHGWIYPNEWDGPWTDSRYARRLKTNKG